MKALLSLYSWRYPAALAYMLQSVEYRAWPYLQWYWRVQDFRVVMQRRTLAPTRAAKALIFILSVGMVVQLLAGLILLALWQQTGRFDWRWAAALVVSYPVVWAHVVILPVMVGNVLVVRPSQRRAIKRSEKIFAQHPAVKLAITGSYGKTTMKEILVTVLSQGCKVAATPANKNVASSHARFAANLAGDEDVLVLEYGEGKPGDVGRLARQTHPNQAVITGIAPAHLDRYKTLKRAAEDIFSIAEIVGPQKTFVNGESADAKPYIAKRMKTYDGRGALGWKVEDVKVSLEGVSFALTMKHAKSSIKKLKKNKTVAIRPQRIHLTSRLLGRHQIGPLAFAAAWALELGLTEKQVKAGIAATAPFEHRMQPYRMSGAWIIDDTYNGNLEGIRAGTALLRELPARRKWYVTPGLVDQGREMARVHRHMGELIAAAKPDTVVLIANSVTGYIQAGLRIGGFEGELHIEPDPLYFYTNLRHFVAAGDLVVMQNDWTDNYA